MSYGYIRDPEAFDPTAYSLANDRTHTTDPGHFSVTAVSHPVLFEVFEVISADNGGGAGHISYSVPDGLADRAALAETFLARLSAEEREIVGNGEHDHVRTIMAKHAQSDAEREDVDDFLNAFFEDWHDVE